MIRGRLRGYLDARLQRRPDALDPEALRADAIVFAPHSDDETLGCGGTIARKRAAGAGVRVVVMTDGANSHAVERRDVLISVRREETLRALSVLGVARGDVFFLGFPDGELSNHLADATKGLRAFLARHPVTQVFLPYSQDGHPDHQATYRVVRAAFNGPQTDVTFWEYPIWAWRHWPWVRLGRFTRTDSGPWRATAKFLFGARFLAVFSQTIDMRETVAIKRAALSHYESQFGDALPSDAWSLARLNGGDFLGCFVQPVEVFRKRVVRAKSD